MNLFVLLQLQLKAIIDAITYYNYFDTLNSNLLSHGMIDIGLKDRFDDDIIIMMISEFMFVVFTN